MSKDEYQRRALDCLALAQLTKDPDHAGALLRMANAWLHLACYSVTFRDTAELVSIATQTKRDEEL
jgi:hypothetical protein